MILSQIQKIDSTAPAELSKEISAVWDEVVSSIVNEMLEYAEPHIGDLHINLREEMALELAKLIAKVVGYDGSIMTDLSKPDGTPRKLTDTSLLRSTGWAPGISLQEGLIRTYADFLEEASSGSLRTI